MPQIARNATECHEQTTLVPESGIEISDIIISHELGREVESQSHENNQDPSVLPESQPPSSQKPDFKSYENEKTVEPCAPTEAAGKDDIIFSGEVEIISKEQFFSNIAQTIPSLKKLQNDSKIPDYVPAYNIWEGVEVGESLPEGARVNQGDDMINIDVNHIDNEPLHTESPPILNEAIRDETPLASPQYIQAFQERETIEHDKMGHDMTDIMPDPERKVSSSPNVQGIFLSHIEEFGDILNYNSNITQESCKRGLDNINSIYKNHWDTLPKNNAHTFLPYTGLDFFKATETKSIFNNTLWNLKLMKESGKPPDNLSKAEHSFSKMVQSLLDPSHTITNFWANVMFESIILVSYNVIAPKPFVAPTTSLTNPLGIELGVVEYLASCLSKSKKRATQLRIEGGGAHNEISTKPHKNLEDLMDTVIHLMIAYNMVCAHMKVKVYGMKGKLTSSKQMRPSMIF
ncbi:hypothetical protein O181_062735, partial [Austropuccinia psidii MF-1]|nr:hypothetical protein [Austropuccinia psidii MF-1]